MLIKALNLVKTQSLLWSFFTTFASITCASPTSSFSSQQRTHTAPKLRSLRLDTQYELANFATPDSTHYEHVLTPPEVPVNQDIPNPNYILHALHSAIHVLQTDFFDLWVGTYTTAIDWTAAVTITHLAATLSSLSEALSRSSHVLQDTPGHPLPADALETAVETYFAHLPALYYTQDTFSLRNQAYDDMLWVVLAWLDGITFIRRHSFSVTPTSASSTTAKWHGTQFIPPFVHRAHIFYELAEKGWDTSLCDGGMLWNPRLEPYKNAITNQLFITASAGMYLHFPGDENDAPFAHTSDTERTGFGGLAGDDMPPSTYNASYLAAAVRAYEWLTESGMRNADGLYVDGFHVSRTGEGAKCDRRNEDVWTYNQGVVLSGLRGLWEATGDVRYLDDGHELVRNVIKATGWRMGVPVERSDANADADVDEERDGNGGDGLGKEYVQRGLDAEGVLGMHGILTERCDASGSCNQDAQAFKGIFMHHLASFCTPLPTKPVTPGKTHASDPVTFRMHRNSCRAYMPWVVSNAQAAMCTRNGRGWFGGWWGAEKGVGAEDPNDRGRGRTVETMGGGMAAVRAAWEILRMGLYESKWA